MRATLALTALAGILAAQSILYAQVVIRTAPPAPVSVAVVGRAPSAGYVWIPGYYRGAGARYVWVAGTWMRPPHRGMVWVQPMWRKGPSGYVFVAGRWR